MREDRSILRQSMYPGMLDVMEYNTKRKQNNIFLYEIGNVFSKKEIELLWIILNAIMVCYDSRLRALFTIDELPAAKELADQRSQSYAELCQIISADTLARDELLLPAETFVKALRESALMFTGRSELIGHLIECNIAGPDYLNEIANENTAPLLIREMQ